MASTRIPVTVLTGFLGAGKTTLLNRILTEPHGLRLAVIENELGEIGIDQALVVNADEEVFEMNNGCICCTVRGDLIRVLGNLIKRRDRFDRILVETTGMADPGPVAQTFFVDEDVRADFVLDGIVTLVDAHHVARHLDQGTAEVREQIGFADVLVLNKIDLVDPDQLAGLERRIRAMNALATVFRTRHADLPVGEVLDVGGFDLDRALARKPTFLDPEYPFEWAGAYQLAPGDQLVLTGEVEPSLTAALVRSAGTPAAVRADAEIVLRRFADRPEPLRAGEALVPDRLARLDLPGAGPHRFRLAVPEAGSWALYLQHRPEEVGLRIERDGATLAPDAAHGFVPAHAHDDAVGSISIELDRPFDQRKLDGWLGRLLRERGPDLYRTKGILAIAGEDRRYVLQAVHMLVDGRPDRPWGDEPPRSQLVFIGKGLDGAELRRGLEECLA